MKVNLKFIKENLTSHKKIIHQLLQSLNKKKDDIYLLNSQNEILEKECRFWIYDFDSLKNSTEMRVHINILIYRKDY